MMSKWNIIQDCTKTVNCVFELHSATEYCVGSGVALQPGILLHTTRQKRCFWMPKMGVFELDDATKYRVGSGGALQAPIPLNTTSQKRCFWIPKMGVFELHNATKYRVGSGVALKGPIPLHSTSQKRWFWIPSMGVFELPSATKYGAGSGVAPQGPIPLHTTSQKRCFLIAKMGVFELDRAIRYHVGSAPSAKLEEYFSVLGLETSVELDLQKTTCMVSRSSSWLAREAQVKGISTLIRDVANAGGVHTGSAHHGSNTNISYASHDQLHHAHIFQVLDAARHHEEGDYYQPQPVSALARRREDHRAGLGCSERESCNQEGRRDASK